MPLQRRETLVEMREGVDAMPDLGTLRGDDVAELVGHPLTVARRAQDGQLSSSIEWQVERTKSDEELKPLRVGRRVVAIAVRRAGRRRQEAGRLVEPNSLRGCAGLACELTDQHGPNGRPSSSWNVKTESGGAVSLLVSRDR